MNTIKLLLSNQISMFDFLQKLKKCPDLQNELNLLIPMDAHNNPEHLVWNGFNFDSIKSDNFNLYNHLLRMFDFDNSIENNFNIFKTIEYFYCFEHPNFNSTKKYDEEFDLFLDLTGETFGGPEVEKFIDGFISKLISIPQKTERIKVGKKMLKELFHVEGNKHPYWIQGAEWPMGKTSPMKYISKIKQKEKTIYEFKDVDTGEIKFVEQFY